MNVGKSNDIGFRMDYKKKRKKPGDSMVAEKSGGTSIGFGEGLQFGEKHKKDRKHHH